MTDPAGFVLAATTTTRQTWALVADIFMPIIAGTLTLIWVRASKRFGAIERGLAAADQALALLVAQASDDKVTLREHGSSISQLQRQTAVLEDRISQYMARPLPPPVSRPGPVPDS